MDEARSNSLSLAICAVLLLARHLTHGLDLLSLLMLAPLLVCLIPALDSLQGGGSIRVWDRWRMRFSWLDRQQEPWSYWINLLVSWPGAVVFALFLLTMPPR